MSYKSRAGLFCQIVTDSFGIYGDFQRGLCPFYFLLKEYLISFKNFYRFLQKLVSTSFEFRGFLRILRDCSWNYFEILFGHFTMFAGDYSCVIFRDCLVLFTGMSIGNRSSNSSNNWNISRVDQNSWCGDSTPPPLLLPLLRLHSRHNCYSSRSNFPMIDWLIICLMANECVNWLSSGVADAFIYIYKAAFIYKRCGSWINNGASRRLLKPILNIYRYISVAIDSPWTVSLLSFEIFQWVLWRMTLEV